jgi:hypothetical protein
MHCLLYVWLQEVRQLLISKYGKQYDMSFVRRNLPGEQQQQQQQQQRG